MVVSPPYACQFVFVVNEAAVLNASAGATCDTNEAFAMISLKDNALGHGKFSVTIIDNDRKPECIPPEMKLTNTIRQNENSAIVFTRVW